MKTLKKRIFFCGLHQESNCFNPIPTPKSMFYIASGDAVRGLWNTTTSVGGMGQRLERDPDIELICGTVMLAPSGAPLLSNVTKDFLASVLSDIREKGKFDGIAVSLHGATMAEDSDDVCGDILEAIRKEVGEEITIAAAFDLHANITQKIMQNTDYVCGYQEYPHIDRFETGERAAALLLAHLNGAPSKMARVTVPMIAPAHGYTTKEGELLALVQKAKEMVSAGRILDYTVFEVQPWLDAKEMAASVIVIAKDEATAKAAARELAKDNFDIRRALLGKPLLSIEAVIEKALNNESGKPVILVDSADSRGAGSTADSAAVLEALLPYKDRLTCALGVSDAPAVEKAFAVGVGNYADFTLGATIAPSLSRPVTLKNALVRSLHNGYFTHRSPISRGAISGCGKVAVLKVGKISIQVSTDSRTEGDPGFFLEFGIDPAFCDLVSVKACTSFRAAYESYAAEICNTATPGAAGTVLTELPYKKRPTPLYPFEEITEEDISEAICYR